MTVVGLFRPNSIGRFPESSAQCQVSCEMYYGKTSGFWPRVRARALRAPVFLGALPCKTGCCAPPRPSQPRCFIFIEQKNVLFPESKASFRPELGSPGPNIFPLDH